METIAIVGVGLIGGSFGLALRAAGYQGRIIGVSSPATIAIAADRGAVDHGALLADAVAEADVVLLATPILAIMDQLAQTDAHVRPGALITDAGSTKARIVERATEVVKRGVFLGGHPMAGKESSGVAHADAGLFRDRPWALCKPVEQLQQAELDFADWVRAVGARPVFFTPQEHDRAVAFSSHLPQLVSVALAAAIGESPRAADLAGPGLMDMTRLAGSPYGLWRDILATNDEPIGAAIDTFLNEMANMRQNLSQHDASELFQAAKNVFSTLRLR